MKYVLRWIYFKGILLIVLVGYTSRAFGQENNQQSTFALAAPVVYVDSLLFTKQALLNFTEGEKGSVLHYQLEDDKPRTGNHKKPIEIKTTSTLKVWSTHPYYQTSDTTTLKFTRANSLLSDAKISIEPEPKAAYRGNKEASLKDLTKGTTNFRTGNDWLGFQTTQVNLTINLKEPTALSLVSLGVLRDYGSWVFLPKQITVESNKKIIGQVNIQIPKAGEKTASTFLHVPIKKGTYKELQIQINTLPTIPQWHMGQGTIPWLFIDELLIN